MLHYNEHFRRHPFTRWFSVIIPEWYKVSSVKDFLDNKLHFLPTKSILPLGVLWRNRTWIDFATSVLYNCIDDRSGEISDLTGSLNVRLGDFNSWYETPHCIGEEKRKALKNGLRLYLPHLVYRPKDQALWLWRYHTHGPTQPDRQASDLELSQESGVATACALR